MASVIENVYTSYEFDSQDEAVIARTFTDLQVKHIRNELAILAEKKVLLAYDPQNPEQFALEHEWMRGGMDAILGLLMTSENNKDELFALQVETAARQNEE
jgi:hypothetical protein